MRLQLNHITLDFVAGREIIRVWRDGKTVLAFSPAQVDFPQVADLFRINFELVQTQYSAQNASCNCTREEFDDLSLKIVVHKMATVRNWDGPQRRYFIEPEDFGHPFFMYVISDYFRGLDHYRSDWKTRAACFMTMTPEQFEVFFERQMQYYNK